MLLSQPHSLVFTRYDSVESCRVIARTTNRSFTYIPTCDLKGMQQRLDIMKLAIAIATAAFLGLGSASADAGCPLPPCPQICKESPPPCPPKRHARKHTSVRTVIVEKIIYVPAPAPPPPPQMQPAVYAPPPAPTGRCVAQHPCIPEHIKQCLGRLGLGAQEFWSTMGSDGSPHIKISTPAMQRLQTSGQLQVASGCLQQHR